MLTSCWIMGSPSRALRTSLTAEVALTAHRTTCHRLSFVTDSDGDDSASRRGHLCVSGMTTRCPRHGNQDRLQFGLVRRSKEACLGCRSRFICQVLQEKGGSFSCARPLPPPK